MNDNSAIQLGSVYYGSVFIIGHLTINSIKNKFGIMKPMLLDDIDIFMVTETKLHDSFPASQFNVEGLD